MSTAFVEAWLTGPQSTQFYCRTWAPKEQRRAAVVFVHGFIEHIGRYEHVFPKWSQRGISVFAFDQRGFGRTATDSKHKSKHSSYGKTSGVEQREDIEWAVKHVKSENGDIPLFLMGHSMGGARAIDFVIQQTAPPSPSTVSLLSGVIATAPFMLQPVPAPALLKWFGRQVISIAPSLPIPTHPFVHPQDMSRDSEVVQAYAADPLIKRQGTVRGLLDMINDGESLIVQGAVKWPIDLPVLLLHGNSDKVALYDGTETFYNAIKAKDKTFVSFVDAYHELHNEPNGVKEKVVEDCIVWVEKHINQAEGTTQARL